MMVHMRLTSTMKSDDCVSEQKKKWFCFQGWKGPNILQNPKHIIYTCTSIGFYVHGVIAMNNNYVVCGWGGWGEGGG